MQILVDIFVGDVAFERRLFKAIIHIERRDFNMIRSEKRHI